MREEMSYKRAHCLSVSLKLPCVPLEQMHGITVADFKHVFKLFVYASKGWRELDPECFVD